MKIIKLEEVVKKTSVSKSTIYEMIKRKDFPAQINLNSVSSGWIESEIDNWIAQREIKIIRIKEVVKKTSVSKSTIYEMIKRKDFPAQIKLNSVSSGWILSEIDSWIAQKIAERNERLIEE